MRTWLRAMRNQRGLTQQSIADCSNIERSYYTMIESGNRNPSVPVAKSIAAAIGFDWTIFFDNVSNETKHNQEKTAI